MMDPNKWIGTLPNLNAISGKEKSELDPNRWVGSISKININSSIVNTNNSIKKYSLTAIMFVIGLILVSVIKNETRNLQKEINDLNKSIHGLNLNLHEAILEYEVITSPENISKLAKEHLELSLSYYKKYQINELNKKEKVLVKLEDDENFKKKNEKLSDEMKLIVAKKIKKKKIELLKLQQLYSKPKKIPGELKSQVAKKIKKKKIELQKLYSNPKASINLKKVKKWAGIQVVKAFLGIPVVPGK